MKIYLASSWRNTRQQEVLKILRDNGHEVYDFRNAQSSFGWERIDLNWKIWTAQEFIEALNHKIAIEGFDYDYDAMNWADCCVLLLPCGRSAHLEAGYFVGAKKPLYILLDNFNEPELMYHLANNICITVDQLLKVLKGMIKLRKNKYA